jgi:hypothetical protein
MSAILEKEKTVLKFILPAAFATLVAVSPASALTSTAPSGLAQATESNLVQQAQAPRRAAPRRAAPRRAAPRRAAPRRAAPRRYAPGARLRAAPRGYRRYSSRPSYWQTRGCIVVGPAWFCP